jgi:hypothetical protein
LPFDNYRYRENYCALREPVPAGATRPVTSLLIKKKYCPGHCTGNRHHYKEETMQIDFHHAVTYVTARLAGFGHDDADTIAYAAQYVDDATNDGVIRFDNDAMYQRISSSHKSMDLGNLKDDENHLVWLPFHFLPANGGLPAGQNVNGPFIGKIVCWPNSPIAKEMVNAALDDKEKPYALCRLGIAMHVFADTFAHQGFCGVLSHMNDVDNVQEIGSSGVYPAGMEPALEKLLTDAIPPLGHGRALVFPDMPFLSWSYTNGWGKKVERNNTEIFLSAADALYEVLCRSLGKNSAKINDADREQIRTLFVSAKNKTEDAGARHANWLAAIQKGTFSFGPAALSYADEGKNSWKAKALGTSDDLTTYKYSDSFLSSKWKLFHDALQKHRLTVLHDILPKYGICAG